MTGYMVFFPCAFGAVSIIVGIAICCRLRYTMDRDDEGDGSTEGRERAAAVGSGNMLPRSHGNAQSQHELPLQYHDNAEYHQHHGNRYGHEQPVVAAVADLQPCVGIVVPEFRGGAPSTGLDSIEYGEAVYVSLPDVALTSKTSYCPEAQP